MHGNGVGKIKLGGRLKRHCGGFVIKAYLHHFKLFVDTLNNTDIAVEDPLAGFAVIAEPADVVVVLYLHDLVARAEGFAADGDFIFALARRIEPLLQFSVELRGAELAFF